MDEVQEIKESAAEKVVIPDSLKEIKNVPEGYVPVYFYEDKTELGRLGAFGFQPELNYMDEARPDMEQIFDDARVAKGITVDRGKCLFVFPRHPDELRGELKFDPEKRVMLEAWVDPEKVLVADGEQYAEASSVLEHFSSKESARDWADIYWDNAVPLKEYLENPDEHNFQMPEALAPGPVPTDYMRVVENPKGIDPEVEY